MGPRFRKSIIILGIFLALTLPGTYGVSFLGTKDGESISAVVEASTSSAAGVSYGAGDYHFYGDGNARYSRKYSTGDTWSEVGVTIKDAENYDGHIGGSKSVSLGSKIKGIKTTNAKLTSAYLDLLAEGAEYINAYGKSGTSKNIGSGVEMTVEEGDAEVSIRTSADGKALTSESSLDTLNLNADEIDAITGSNIDIKGYYTGSKGELTAKIEDGAISGYHLWASSAQGGSRAVQSAESAFGGNVEFASYTKETISGKTREMTANTAITEGYVNGYWGMIDDHARTMAHSTYQQFDDAGTSYDLAATTTYIETTRNARKKAEEYVRVYNGAMTGYSSSAKDPFLTKNPGVNQYAEQAEGGAVEFYNHYIEVSKKASRDMFSSAYVDDGNVNGFYGRSESAKESGTEHFLDAAQGRYINLQNYYSDNLRSNGGWGQVGVALHDSAASQTGEEPTGTLTDYAGKAKFATTDVGTTMKVRAQGHTDQMDVSTDATAYYNEQASDSYSATDGKNYFIGEASSSSPWEVTAISGRQVAPDESIQEAINGMSDADGNIFLLPGTYNEYDIANNEVDEKSFTLWGAGSYLDGERNSVIDAGSLGRTFSLYSYTGNRVFAFKNIDFKNGYDYSHGGAIEIRGPGAGFTSTANIENSNFNNNRAYYGGAIENWGGELNIKDCSFDGNQADGDGGAILNWGTITADGCTFEGNTAAGNGGAYAATSDGATGMINTITNSDFQNNAAGTGGLGNAIYVKGPATNTFELNTYGPGQNIVIE